MPRGGMAARGPPVGVLRSAAHRRAESRFWGVFIIAVHRAFVLGLGARHRGIVELSEGVIRCVTVFACYSSSSSCTAPAPRRSPLAPALTLRRCFALLVRFHLPCCGLCRVRAPSLVGPSVFYRYPLKRTKQ